MGFAPIALFVYRRPDHTRRALQSLIACAELSQSPLYVFCDGPKTPEVAVSTRATREVARRLAPPSTIFVEQEHNQGLARSIISGVTELTAQFGKVIVVEDDLVVAPSFLRFMNRALDHYATDDAVMQVSGYQFPVEPPFARSSLFFSFPTSWGWGTWSRAWKHFDPTASAYQELKSDRALRRRFDLDGSYPYFDMLERQLRGDIDSWAIRWHASIFMRGGLVLFPGRSLVRNGGFDGSGTHRPAPFASAALVADSAEAELPPPALDSAAEKRVFQFLRTQKGSSQLKNRAVKFGQGLLSGGLQRLPSPIRGIAHRLLARARATTSPDKQDLDIYWDPEMAAVLETWGLGNAWNEIQLLLLNVHGSVVDIACGTGKVMEMLRAYPALELHGFDISEFLLQKAIDRGIPRERLKVADATKTDYADNSFDYGYSIGSLEHFTEDGILKFVAETKRITRVASFHQMPTSRSGKNEGWMKTVQSFHNNSVDWWRERFLTAYPTVHVLDSAWNDRISVGKWFVGVNEAG